MTRQGADERARTLVRKIEFARRFANDRRDLAIMHMTYVGEQMMFDLKIQTSDIPGKPSALISEIGRGVKLMDRPVIFQRVVFVR